MKIYLNQITQQLIICGTIHGMYSYETLHRNNNVKYYSLNGKSPAELCLYYIGEF